MGAWRYNEILYWAPLPAAAHYLFPLTTTIANRLSVAGQRYRRGILNQGLHMPPSISALRKYHHHAKLLGAPATGTWRLIMVRTTMTRTPTILQHAATLGVERYPAVISHKLIIAIQKSRWSISDELSPRPPNDGIIDRHNYRTARRNGKTYNQWRWGRCKIWSIVHLIDYYNVMQITTTGSCQR